MSTARVPNHVAERYPHSYAVVDVETTGLEAQHHRVIQIAVALMTAEGQVEDRWSTLVRADGDPGPTHVHGITRGMLETAPTFADIASELTQRMSGRVMVAHNAEFDWRFLDAELQRIAMDLPVAARLCTMQLAKRLELPIRGFSLQAVSAYWGVRQLQAHNAEDDVRVVTEVLRHALIESERIDLQLPLATPRRLSAPYPVRAPRVTIPHQNPGQWSPGSLLQEGMSVVVTGPTDLDRSELYRRLIVAGLQPRNSVSRQTSLLICNDPDLLTVKHIRAKEYDVPIVHEGAVIELIAGSTARIPHQATEESLERMKSADVPVDPIPAQATSIGPEPMMLAVRRVLVLGGSHHEAAAVRRNIVAMGGQAAVRMTATVTDLVLLEGARADPRWDRISELGLRVLDAHTFHPIESTTRPSDSSCRRPYQQGDARNLASAPIVLPRGGVTDLPSGLENLTVTTAWAEDLEPELDIVAFVVGPDDRVGADHDFCFYNQLEHPSKQLVLKQDLDGSAELKMNLTGFPDQSVIVAAALEQGSTFADVGPVEISLHDGDGAPVITATLDAATEEQTMLLGRIYRRGKAWRFRAEGQGYTSDLATLARNYGVSVDD